MIGFSGSGRGMGSMGSSMPYMQHPARDALQLVSDPTLMAAMQNSTVRARTRQQLNRHSLPYKGNHSFLSC